MSEILPCVVVGPKDANFSVIWLHGLGADGHDFEPIVPELDFKNKAQTRFVFPHAPERPVTLNQGHVMRAWYDIIELNSSAKQDEEGIRTSEQQLIALIENEIAMGVTSENIVVAGFSQGGVIALQTALRYPKRLAGIMALSTYLALTDKLKSEQSDANKNIDLFMAHGEFDQVIPLLMAESSRQFLVDVGYSVSWHPYPMEHSVIPQEIDDISRWLNNALR